MIMLRVCVFCLDQGLCKYGANLCWWLYLEHDTQLTVLNISISTLKLFLIQIFNMEVAKFTHDFSEFKYFVEVWSFLVPQ